MKEDLEKLRQDIVKLYQDEHRALGEQGTLQMLEEAGQWNLAPTLQAGGVLVFPHVGVADCGRQVAAVVQACLDSGAERVLLVSVLHAFTDEMEQARIRVANGEDPSQFTCWGIQGPGLEGRDEWRYDHVLTSFHHFWDAETRRRGLQGQKKKIPQVIERYPYLAGGHPERLPGIEELEKIAADAVVISTADSFHHGIGYGDPPEKALYPHAGGLELARKTIQDGIEILERGDYWGYNQHCVRAKSDARDAGQVFRYLRGSLQGRILDLTDSDAAELYHAPAPTWVAAALVEWIPARS
jgi:hypothetical protein